MLPRQDHVRHKKENGIGLKARLVYKTAELHLESLIYSRDEFYVYFLRCAGSKFDPDLSFL